MGGMAVSESAVEDKFHEIFQIFETSDRELGEDLWLIAERILLFRLTRAGELKRIELASMVHLIHEIVSETGGVEKLSPEIIQLDKSASDGFKGSSEASLSLVFTTVVDETERMNPEQLYRLISGLRKIELPRQNDLGIEPLEKAQEYLGESIAQDSQWDYPEDDASALT
jgi:hypothetical protein